jgi:capping protein alpha
MDFNYELQFVDIKGKIQVDAHYFEEGNVQLDTNIDCKDSTIMQSPDDCAVSITNIIRHHESEYLSSLEESYLNLSDATFKDLRRKLPVTRTLFPWHNTLAFSLTRDLAKELALGK